MKIDSLLNKFRVNLLLLIGIFFLPSITYAQNTFDAPGSDDMSVQFIGQIFGGLVGSGSDAFGSSISTFNSVVLIVGGILVGYTIFAGTLGTAHDGEMLGKKFSSVWVPIRTTLGTALILPSMKGGYCAMQAIVMWLILQGVGFANSVWSSYVSSSALDSAFNPKISGTAGAMIEKFVYKVYALQVCVAAENQAIADTSSSVQTTDKIMTKTKSDSTDLAQVDEVGFDKLGQKTYCGKITYPIQPSEKDMNKSAGGSDSAASASIDSINKILQNQVKVDTSAIYKAQIDQAKSIVKATEGIAKGAIKTTDASSSVPASLNSLVEGYKTALNSASNTAVASAKQNLNDVAKTQGWFMAGTFATKIILVQGLLASAQNSTGSASATKRTGSVATTAADDKLLSYYNNGRGWLPEYKQITDVDGEGYSRVVEADVGNSAADETFLGKLTASIIQTFTDIDLSRLQSDTRHPILIAQDMGSSIMKVCWAMTVSNVLFGLGAGLSNAFLGALCAFCGTLAAPILLMWGVAGFLAYGLPNLPLLIWLGVLMGWVTMVIQAILAAPLWAVMHLHPNGDDLTGKGGNGYMMVLGLTLRPALIIFGLIAAIVLSNLFGQFLNAIFMSSVTTPNSINDMFNLVFIIVIYTALLTGVIQSTFSLVHKVPDELLRWIGGGHEQLGEFGRLLESGTMNKVTAATGMVQGAASNLHGTAKQAGRGISDDIAKNKATDEHNKERQEDKDSENTDFMNQKMADTELPEGAAKARFEAGGDPKSAAVASDLKDLKNVERGFKEFGDNGQMSSSFGKSYANALKDGKTHQEAVSIGIDDALKNNPSTKSLSEDTKKALSSGNGADFFKMSKNISGNEIN